MEEKKEYEARNKRKMKRRKRGDVWGSREPSSREAKELEDKS